jgi:hypothetical protein
MLDDDSWKKLLSGAAFRSAAMNEWGRCAARLARIADCTGTLQKRSSWEQGMCHANARSGAARKRFARARA